MFTGLREFLSAGKRVGEQATGPARRTGLNMGERVSTKVLVIADDLTGAADTAVEFRGLGPAYALVREEGRNGAPARFFHTSDRSLVEHLTFRLQEELALPPVPGQERS